MSKIFVSFFNAIKDPENPNAMPCFYDSFLKSLKENGNTVLYFSNNFFNQEIGKAPSWFIEKVKSFEPDLIILFNNSCYDLSKEFDCPIIIWEVDSYLYFSNIEKIKLNPDRYKFIVPQEISIQNIKDNFKANSKNIFVLQPATAIKAKKMEITSNIVFIGTKFGTNNLTEGFIRENPTKNEIEKFNEIVNYIEKNPYSTKKQIIKNLLINSEKIKKYIDIKKIVEDISAKNRIQILSSVANLGLKIYGTKSWTENLPYNPELLLSFQNKPVYSLKDNQDIYNSSKIGININHVQAQNSFSLRLCDIMASNACLVTQFRKEFKTLFPKVNIPTYNNPYEAYKICQKLLEDDSYRLDIISSSHEIINKKYRFPLRLKELEEIIGTELISNNKGKITKLNYLEKKEIVIKKDIVINKKSIHIKFSLPKIKIPSLHKFSTFRIQTRLKLIFYSFLLTINQIPIINKPFISRNEILFRINNTINNEFGGSNNTITNISHTLSIKKNPTQKTSLTKIKLMLYSILLFIKQIPLIGKSLMNNNEIINKIEALVNNEKNNQTTTHHK